MFLILVQLHNLILLNNLIVLHIKNIIINIIIDIFTFILIEMLLKLKIIAIIIRRKNRRVKVQFIEVK